MYLRATTADGQVLPGTELTVKRAWDPKDPGVKAVADEDGVAALQLDPGVPVNVVVPAMPVRRKPLPNPVELAGSSDLLADGGEVGLEDQVALERWLPAFFSCARFVTPDTGSTEEVLAVRVSTSGAVADVIGGRGRLPDCLAQAARSRTLPPGRERMLSLTFQLVDPQLPTLGLEASYANNDAPALKLEAAVQEAAKDARTCLPAKLSEVSSVPAVLRWRTRAGKKDVEVSWIPVPRQEGVPQLSPAVCWRKPFAE